MGGSPSRTREVVILIRGMRKKRLTQGRAEVSDELTNPARPKRQILRPARVRRLDIRPSSAGQSPRDQALDAAFFVRAEMQKNASHNQSEADADYEKAAHWAALVAPYRHARRSAMKLPNSPVRIRDDGSVDELQYFTQQSRVCGNV
jgi:hypothetical protein